MPQEQVKRHSNGERSHKARHEVRVGDAYDLAETVDASTVDLLITSPPYWGLRTYGLEHNWDILAAWKKSGRSQTDPPSYDWYRRNGGILGLEPLPEWYLKHLVEILDKFARSLKPSGSMWINIGDVYFSRWASIRPEGRQGLGDTSRLRRRGPMGGFRQEKNLLLLPSRFAIHMQELRWIVRNDLIWFKPNVPPRPERDRLRLCHEHFFHLVKRPSEGRAKYYYDLSEVEAGAHDVVLCNVRSGEDGHSATFPEDIVRPRIASSSPPGGVVLDPFCGTGRALVAAARSGRQTIGFEISDRFAEVARKSIANLTLGESRCQIT